MASEVQDKDLQCVAVQVSAKNTEQVINLPAAACQNKSLARTVLPSPLSVDTLRDPPVVPFSECVFPGLQLDQEFEQVPAIALPSRLAPKLGESCGSLESSSCEFAFALELLHVPQ